MPLAAAPLRKREGRWRGGEGCSSGGATAGVQEGQGKTRQHDRRRRPALPLPPLPPLCCCCSSAGPFYLSEYSYILITSKS